MAAKREPPYSWKRPKFCVGDRIKIMMGDRWGEGVAIEDRGPLGAGGERIYRISVPMPPAEPWEAELPAEMFTAAG